jgi:hypothetical protein
LPPCPQPFARATAVVRQRFALKERRQTRAHSGRHHQRVAIILFAVAVAVSTRRRRRFALQNYFRA